MKIDIRATKVELTDDLKSYIQKKMDMLEKYLGEIKVIDCYVNISLTVGGQKNGDIYRVEVIMKLPHQTLMVEKIEKDIFKSIDKVKDHLKDSIVQHKEKMIDKRRKTE